MPDQLIAAQPRRHLERAIHRRQIPRRVGREDRVRRRLDELRVADLRAFERQVALAFFGDVARDTEDADDVRRVANRCVGHRRETRHAVWSNEPAVVPSRLTEERRLELLLHHRLVTRRDERQRTSPEQLGVLPPDELARRLVHRREHALRVDRVDRVRRRLEQIPVSRFRLADRVARATLVFHGLTVTLGGRLGVLVQPRVRHGDGHLVREPLENACVVFGELLFAVDHRERADRAAAREQRRDQRPVDLCRDARRRVHLGHVRVVADERAAFGDRAAAQARVDRQRRPDQTLADTEARNDDELRIADETQRRALRVQQPHCMAEAQRHHVVQPQRAAHGARDVGERLAASTLALAFLVQPRVLDDRCHLLREQLDGAHAVGRRRRPL